MRSIDILQCVQDINAFVLKFYTLFSHSLAAKLVVHPENDLILSDHPRMGCYLDSNCIIRLQRMSVRVSNLYLRHTLGTIKNAFLKFEAGFLNN